ncbi:MAG: InlB B-repeat-containing protein [Clostridia bacterium]|nr:InlB B-repeat-containing protein [Clostridia bacterium]
MIKKLAIGISCIITVAATAALAGCGGEKNYDELYADKVKVVYELEGGKYLNSTTSVNHYYDYRAGLTITPLEDKKFSKDGVTRDGGFILEGWYLEKTAKEDGTAEYSKQWNFATDTVPQGGITLYAKWKAPIKYSYDFIYVDGDEERVVLSENVSNGSTCESFLLGTDMYEYLKWHGDHPDNTTVIGVYYDAEFKEQYDPADTTHVPTETGAEGEEKGDTVKLYLKYIEGVYTVVSTKQQLLDASSDESIYLTADIDMEGEKINFNSCKQFDGNGHKVYNFALEYTVSFDGLVDVDDEGNSDALCISLFGNAKNVTVRNVTFENMTVTIDTSFSRITRIYVSPLAVTATNSTFEKVTVTNCAIEYKLLPDDFDIDRLFIVTDRGVYSGEEGTEKECKYENITVTDKTEE